MTARKRAAGLLLLGSMLCLSACLERELVPLNPCLVSGVSRQVTVNNVDKVDLLFMVDNSNSMADKQISLKAQFPKLVTVLTSGMRNATDTNPFPPVKDMHVGVVSSDMGLPGVANNFGCDPNGGDDGRLQHMPKTGANAGCMANYPTWLSYSANTMPPTDQNQFATDFQCIASLGTGGCGFEEQLEAPLKALWPSIYLDTKGNVVTPNPITFLSTTAAGQLGHGDVDPAKGGNGGFLRNDLTTGLSLIAIVLLTDEDDCSPRQIDFLKPREQAAAPYNMQDINLRCYYNQDKVYDVKSRYFNGFRALRPGNENLVIFAAITGVPTDLVDDKARAGVDFTDQAQSDAYYDRILGDSRMQIQIDPSTHPGMGDGGGNLLPACQGTDPQGHNLIAQAAVRIVNLAKLFGPNGVIQSICQEDFGPAMDAIIDVIAKQLGAVCLPRALIKQANGEVACNVVWELPPPNTAPASTPTVCGQPPYAFLGPVDAGRATINDRKGNNCKVPQLPVDDATFQAKVAPNGDGWYYDNYSSELVKACPANQQQRVAFTATSKPPTGVVVKLECLNETQRVPNTEANVSTAIAQPEIGTPCGMDTTVAGAPTGDAACIVDLTNGMSDTSMFCHATLQVCARACQSSTTCPPAWVCDTRPASIQASGGKAYCVNPTCGSDTTTM